MRAGGGGGATSSSSSNCFSGSCSEEGAVGIIIIPSSEPKSADTENIKRRKIFDEPHKNFIVELYDSQRSLTSKNTNAIYRDSGSSVGMFALTIDVSSSSLVLLVLKVFSG
jgi:hypothetical protein